MKQQKMIAKQIQKGVKFYYKEVPDLYHDKKTAYCVKKMQKRGKMLLF